MGGLFSPPSLPAIPSAPLPPTISDPAVTQASQDAVKQQAMAQGRASTFLTNPADQQTPDTNKQRYLGMA